MGFLEEKKEKVETCRIIQIAEEVNKTETVLNLTLSEDCGLKKSE